MPHYIKTGYWDKKSQINKDALNLDAFVDTQITAKGYSDIPIVQPETLNISGKIGNTLNLGAYYNTPNIDTINLIFYELESFTNRSVSCNIQGTSGTYSGNYRFNTLSFPKLKRMDWHYWDVDPNISDYGNSQLLISYCSNLLTLNIPLLQTGTIYVQNNTSLTDINVGIGIIDLKNPYAFPGDSYTATSYINIDSTNTALQNVTLFPTTPSFDYGYGFITINSLVTSPTVNIDASKMAGLSVESTGNIYFQDFTELKYGGLTIRGLKNSVLNFPKAITLYLNIISYVPGVGDNLTTINFPVVETLSLNVLKLTNEVPDTITITIPDSCTILYLGNFSTSVLVDIINLSHVTRLYGSDASVNFYNCLLTQSCVDAILAKFAEMIPLENINFSELDLSGGANAVPSATGLLNVDLLVAAGISVFHN
jgi:hypothetical protein